MQSNRVCHRHSITVSYRPKKDLYENGFLSMKSELLESLPYSRRISDPKVCNPKDYSSDMIIIMRVVYGHSCDLTSKYF